MRTILGIAVVFAALCWLGAQARDWSAERVRLERLAAERDARAEQNRLNFLEYERQQRAIPVYRPETKPGPGQRDA